MICRATCDDKKLSTNANMYLRTALMYTAGNIRKPQEKYFVNRKFT